MLGYILTFDTNIFDMRKIGIGFHQYKSGNLQHVFHFNNW